MSTGMAEKMKKTALALGLMSGTSADGLSIALCEIDIDGDTSGKHGIRTLELRNYEYAATLHEKIISAKDMLASDLAELNFELGGIWAGMVRQFFAETGYSYSHVSSIASHGQTVWHDPFGKCPNTLQIGEASFIAEETGIPVVCDFRPMDMAAGGQGAPLVPFLDEYLYGDSEKPVALQNIGGVGNISFTGKGVGTFGFDTGPGNSLMDTAVSIYTSGRQSYDADGIFAAAGNADMAKIEKFLSAEYFERKPPKSLDRSTFALPFLERNFAKIHSGMDRQEFSDIMATLNAFTAAAIAKAFAQNAPEGTDRIIVSGGGALNPVLMRNISEFLRPFGVKTLSIADEGMHPLAKEAACFALMGLRAVRGEYNHCPAATGAKGRRILGKIIKAIRN